LKKEHTGRLRMILKSELHAKNTVTAVGGWAVAVLRYRFGLVGWRQEGKHHRQLNYKGTDNV